LNTLGKTLIAAAMVASVALGALLQEYGVLHMPKRTQYLKTKEPLLLNAGGETRDFHLLPAGTPLFKDHSFPEGHTTYIAYVNIKGDFAAEHIETDKVNFSAPIWARPVDKEEVSKLLSDVPVSKEELVSILKARKMTREDLAQIVREWKDE
jgi:hypothetical protein